MNELQKAVFNNWCLNQYPRIFHLEIQRKPALQGGRKPGRAYWNTHDRPPAAANRDGLELTTIVLNIGSRVNK